MLTRCLIVLFTALLSLSTYASSIDNSSSDTINPDVLDLAMTAYQHANQQHIGVKNHLLTIVDFSLPSTEKRLWVINPDTKQILMSALVAHGMNSGLDYTTHFSNAPRSKESSLGLYLTENTYYGDNGYSLRLKGLDNGFNSNAESRDIVVHGAWYVSPEFAASHHYLGRSWGCFAVSQQKSHSLISLIKNDSLLFAYYPNQDWLNHSRFLA